MKTTLFDFSKIIKRIVLDIYYPVGRIVHFYDERNPGDLWGGTWARIGTGRTLIDAGDGYALGSTGGEMEVALTIRQMPTHRHEGVNVANNYLTAWATENAGNGNGFELSTLFRNTLGDGMNIFSGGYAGDGEPHNNMPPYLAVTIWRRTA